MVCPLKTVIRSKPLTSEEAEDLNSLSESWSATTVIEYTLTPYERRSIKELKNQHLTQVATDEFYLSHKVGSRNDVGARSLEMVYDGFGKRASGLTSHPLTTVLNLDPLNKILYGTRVARARFYPVAITGDLRKAFFQIWIGEEGHDSLRFYQKRTHRLDIEIFHSLTFAFFG